MKHFFESLLLLVLFALGACTQLRSARYSEMIDPLVGSGKKEQLDKMLGVPTFCKQESPFQKCEYRTAAGHNDPTPDAFAKKSTMPDVSPYEYFDVIHLFYDDQRVLKEWQAVVLKP